MADTHEKKAEKKVVKHEPEHKEAPAHKAVTPAPRAPEHGGEHAPKAPPVKKVEPRPAPKADEKPASKAQEKPAPKAEPKPAPAAEPSKEAAVEEAAPAKIADAPPAGGEGELEGEIVEEPGEKGKTGETGKTGEKGETGKKGKKKTGRKERKLRIKPELSPEVARALELRKGLKDKTPHFIRQEAYNYGRLSKSWRKPRGTHSKMRHHIKYRINVVSIGYGGPTASKGLHPSGFREVLVHHPLELDRVDPKTQAARIGHSVGSRKRLMIEQRAQRKGIRVLNELQE